MQFLSFIVRSFPILVLVLVVSGCASEQQSSSFSQPAFYRNLENAQVPLDVNDAVRVISTYRRANGLSPVKLDPSLVVLSQGHAISQARANKVGHEVGGSFRSRVRALEEARGRSVENVSAGYRSFAEAFSGWRDSKRHNDNLLNPDVTRLGIAKAVNPQSKYRVFWTLIMTSEPL